MKGQRSLTVWAVSVDDEVMNVVSVRVKCGGGGLWA